MTITSRLAVAGGLVVLLAGCSTFEPYQRAHTWHPTGANQANLAVMVVNPADLEHGRGALGSDGATAAAAVDRLRHDRVKPLEDSNSLNTSTPTAAAGLTAN